MKFTIIIVLSIVSITTTVRVPSIWPLSGENFQGVFPGENRPVRQNKLFTPTNPGYSPNIVNGFVNNVPNIRASNLDGNKNIITNLPGVNNDWIPIFPPNNVQNLANGNDGFGFDNILNPQFGNANGKRKKPYIQQKQGPPRFIQKAAKFNGSPGHNIQKLASVPEQNQIQYITYTTQLPTAQLNGQSADFSTIHPVENVDLTQKPLPNQIQYITYTTQLPLAQLNAQEAAYSTIQSVENFNNIQKSPQTLNMKQAYPKVNNPVTAIPLRELDFNPKNPFPGYQQNDVVLENTLAPQVISLNQGASLRNPQTAGNFDFSLNNPFPQYQLGSKPLNGRQISQAPRLPHRHIHSQAPHGQNKVSSKPPLANLDFDPRNPFTKNYRDDRTHEPDPRYDPNLDTEEIPKVERLQSEKAPVTYHEHPAEVPTKPIYPGEGKWAKQGVKHKPFISKHKYTNLEESKEKPDGYDTFLEAQQLFENQQNRFGKKLQEFPQKHQLDTSNTNQRVKQDNEEAEEEDEDGIKEPFVPTRLYAQVRHSEDEKHLPTESDEHGRLKELIKDSKIQTIYSEEGYEDSAYDHAGHEKNAENVEGLEANAKKLETVEKKKDPAKKYDLHLPQHQSTSYSKGDVDLKEEDVDKLKKEELKLGDEDSESAGTHHEEQANLNKVKPPKKIFSAKTKDSNKKPNINISNNFVKSKELKTMTTLDRGNGNTEMEISSEVKLILQPNNSTKSHKYVKIYPKTYKTLQTDDRKNESYKIDDKIDKNSFKIKTNINTDGIFIEEVTNKLKNVTNTFTTVAPTEYPEIFTVEIPATTQATTAIPKVTVATLDLLEDGNSEVMKNIDKEFPKVTTHNRKKRNADVIPEIQVDTDFIDDINHELGKPKKPKDLTKTKYPYYHQYKEKGLHENSPLRYSESLQNIPIKTEGTLAFYDQADVKMECPEVDPSVDPVPDRIKNAEEDEEQEESADATETAKSPRLGQLGDKIDCLKVKYFGENPLDSPFFKEELVGPPKPIFNEIEGFMAKNIQNHSKNEKRPDVGARNSRHTKRHDLNVGRDTIEITEQIPSASGYEKENEIEDSIFDKFFGKKFQPSKFFSRNRKGDAIEKIQKFVKKYLDKNDSQESKKKTQSKTNNFNDPIDDKRLGFNILNDVVGNMKNPKDDVENIKIVEIPKEVRTLPPATLITTPMYTINLKPKHIYDQIELLQYLPPEESLDIKKETVTDIPIKSTTDFSKKKKTQKIINMPVAKKNEMDINIPDVKKMERESERQSKELKNKIEKMFKHDSERQAKELKSKIEEMFKHESEKQAKERQNKDEKILIHDTGRQAKVLENKDEKIETFGDDSSESPPEADALQRRRRTKPKRPLYQIFDINRYLPKVPYPTTSAKNYAQDYVTNSDFFYATRAPTIQIFDINKYLPTTPPIIKQAAAASTVLPKYKVISEVFYKDDIKPNEQLNVFNDVLNNIKNSPQPYHDNFLSASHSVSVKLPTTRTSTTTTDKSTTPSEIQQSLPKNHQTHPREKYFEINNKRKRHRIKTTTQKVPEVLEETTPITEEEISEESVEVMGLMPPVSHRYKTIYNPKRDNSLHVSNYGITGEQKLNKYLVPGMKPPPEQRVYVYSDYLTNNHIRSRIGKPKRYKRSANRPAYAEVTRNRNKQQEVTEKVETKKDDDDYVPQRSRNYHYDEKTGKIVYDKKPDVKQEESEEEVEYIEVEEETPKTTEKPKQNPIFATATPPPAGQSYTDFVNLLKSASNYKEIPDPTTTEKGAEVTTTNIVTTTIKPVSTTPPEFLSILAKVRSDDKYKLIEDKKKAKVTTTTEAIEIEEEEVEEESQVENIRNSPGRHSLGEGTNLELFDIVDFLPNIKSYLPKTSIDTSKYKSIERPTLRHNLSSRYSSEEDKDLQNINTSKKPILSNTDETSKIPLPSESKIAGEAKEDTYPSTTTTIAPAATEQPQSPKIRTPNRRRTTTPKSALTTQEVITTTSSSVTTTTAETPQNDKARRNYRRKSPRIKLRPTTEKNGTDNTTETVRRRLERDSGMPDFVDEDIDYEESESRNDDKDIYEIFNGTNSNRLLDQTKKADIIKDYNETQNHGGIYKNEYDSQRSQEEKNVTPKPNQSDDIIKEFVAILNTYDNTKKHGGKYKLENEDRVPTKEQTIGDSKSNESKKIKDVDVYKTYDQSKKHGGTYRSEIEDLEQIKEPLVAGPKNVDDVNTFKTYNHAKKHGGNYKRGNEDITQINEKAVVNPEKTELKSIADVDIFKAYDSLKKHGGNYKPKSEDIVPIKQQAVIDPDSKELKNIEAVNTFKTFDLTKKHGGNYRSEDEDVPVKEQAVIDPETKELENNDKVNIFKTYDHTKKHGGNYRAENEDVPIREQQYEESQVVQPKEILNKFERVESRRNNDIEVFKNYDKNKKHGGNYKIENDSTAREREAVTEANNAQIEVTSNANVNKINDVEIFNNYDKNKKHGGNYKRENVNKEQLVGETQFTKITKPDRKDVQRLADVILKPESFYTDVQLPIAINELHIVNDLSNEDLEEIVASVDEEQLNGEFGSQEKNKIEIDDNSISAEPAGNTKAEDIDEALTTKKPLFIKDPSKRLYYYAPLR